VTLPDRSASGDGPFDRAGPALPILEAVDLVREYPSGDATIQALRGVDLTARPGQLLAVRGRSGSGKTTLLNILGGLDRPTSGRVLIDGAEISAMSEERLVDIRRRSVAFIFQSFGLVPIL
jgi:putative ABC transport system ATP-binding protein